MMAGAEAVSEQPQGENGQPREKRSRDRNGRERGPRGDRNDRGDRPPRDSQQPLEGFANESTDAGAAPGFVEPAARGSYFSAPAATAPAPAAAMPMTASDEAVQPAAALAPAPAVKPPVAPAAPAAAVATPVAAAVATAAAKPGLPKVQSFDLPVDSLVEVAQGSGLSWVNSDPAKIASVQAAIAAEPKPIHVPRERPAPVTIDAGPLVLVETKRDLRNMTLPFEQTTPQ